MIIVMSDSHGESEVIQNIKDKYQSDDNLIIHCGDSELAASDPIWNGISVVRGNCDYDEKFPNYQVLTTKNATLFVTHGHLYQVNFGLQYLSDIVAQNHCQVALFGHLHTPIATIENDILCLNPGSVSQPRGHYQTKMYATIDVTADSYLISYRDLAHQPIPSLQFNLPRHKQ